MAKTTLRRVIDEAVERAFVAGATWALIESGVDSAKANRQVNEWRKRQTPPALPIIQPQIRDQICRAVMEAAISQTAIDQERLWGDAHEPSRANQTGPGS